MHKTRSQYKAAAAAFKARLARGEDVHITELATTGTAGKFTSITRYFADLSDARAVAVEWMDVAYEHRLSFDFFSCDGGVGGKWVCSLSMQVTCALDTQDAAPRFEVVT